MSQRASLYRPDIDGLRALAVLSVVTFHVRQSLLPGGFLGVDIFFVISGFLITQIIVRESNEGTFTIARFYSRRIRRIGPALVALLITASVAATILLLPVDLMGFARSVIATLFFVSNIYFWRDTDYFSRAAEDKPLLHTWTLGVEEQFYILFPLLLGFLVPRSKSLTAWIVIAITLISLAINVLALRIGAALPAFYLLPTRVWELGIGALLAITRVELTTDKSRNVASLVGIALIIAALVVPMLVPSNLPAALPPVVGAALLIWSGTNSQSVVARVLSLRPAVGIGLISYSLYLWHWPILVLMRYYSVTALGVAALAVCVSGMFAAAWVSWRYIERPFRDRKCPTRLVVGISAAGTIMLLGSSTCLIAMHGLPSRLDADAAQINAAVGTNYRCPVSKYIAFGPARACQMELPSRNPSDADVVLLGNSHAQMYAPIVERILQKRKLHGLVVVANSCIPVMGGNISEDCQKLAEGNIEAVAALRKARVVLIAFKWQITEQLLDDGGRSARTQGVPGAIPGLDRAIHVLEAAGKRVVLIGPIAIPDYDVASVVSRSRAFHRPMAYPLSRTKAEFEAAFGPAIRYYERRSDIIFVRPDTAQCGPVYCDYLVDGRSLFADSNHLAQSALPMFRSILENAIDTATNPESWRTRKLQPSSVTD